MELFKDELYFVVVNGDRHNYLLYAKTANDAMSKTLKDIGRMFPVNDIKAYQVKQVLDNIIPLKIKHPKVR